MNSNEEWIIKYAIHIVKDQLTKCEWNQVQSHTLFLFIWNLQNEKIYKQRLDQYILLIKERRKTVWWQIMHMRFLWRIMKWTIFDPNYGCINLWIYNKWLNCKIYFVNILNFNSINFVVNEFCFNEAIICLRNGIEITWLPFK